MVIARVVVVRAWPIAAAAGRIIEIQLTSKVRKEVRRIELIAKVDRARLLAARDRAREDN